MTTPVDLRPIARKHRRLWLGARILYLLIFYPMFLVLVIQTWNPIVDNAVFYGGPPILLAAFLVAFFVAGRFVARWGVVAAVSFIGYLLVNVFVLYDKILSALIDGSFFEFGNLILNTSYFGGLFVTGVAAHAGFTLNRLLIEPLHVSFREILTGTSSSRAGRSLVTPGIAFRSHLRGVLMLVCGAGGVGLACWLFVLDNAIPRLGLTETLTGDLYRALNVGGFAVVSLCGILAWRAGLRRVRVDALSQMAADPRPPVLLLRSFQDDALSLRPISFLSALQRRRIRLEEAIAREAVRIGPFIATGAPGERLPELGAYRAYFSDPGWQQAVLGWIDQARVIFVVAGLTEWVQWELCAILERGAMQRVLLLVSSGNPDERRARWEHLCRCLVGSPWHAALTSADAANALAVHFGPDGNVVIFTGTQDRECDYRLAIRAGLYATVPA